MMHDTISDTVIVGVDTHKDRKRPVTEGLRSASVG